MWMDDALGESAAYRQTRVLKRLPYTFPTNTQYTQLRGYERGIRDRVSDIQRGITTFKELGFKHEFVSGGK